MAAASTARLTPLRCMTGMSSRNAGHKESRPSPVRTQIKLGLAAACALVLAVGLILIMKVGPNDSSTPPDANDQYTSRMDHPPSAGDRSLRLALYSVSGSGPTRKPLGLGRAQLIPVSLPQTTSGRWDPIQVEFNESGRAETVELPIDSHWRLQCWADGHARKELTVRVPEEHEVVEIELLALASLVGRVVDDGGRPISGAEVELFFPPGSGRSSEGAKLISGKDGEFEFRDVPPELEARLIAFKAETGQAVQTVGKLAAGSRIEVILIIGKQTSIVGRIPFPIPAGAETSLASYHHSPGPGQLVESEAGALNHEGQFRITGIPPGGKTLVYRHLCTLEATYAFGLGKAVADQETDFGTLSTSNSAISIAFNVEGADSEELSVQMKGQITANGISYPIDLPFQIRDGNTLVLRGLPAGLLQCAFVVMMTSDPQPRKDRHFESARISSDFTGGAVTHTVHLVRKELPGEIAVSLNDRPGGIAAEALDPSIVIEQNGRAVKASGRAGGRSVVGTIHFGFTVPAGEYRIHVLANGWRSESITVSVQPGTTLDIVPRGWSRAAPISGLVVDDAGHPVAGAHVIAARADATPEEWPLGQAIADATGRFVIPGLPLFGGVSIFATWQEQRSTAISIESIVGASDLILRIGDR